MKGKGYISGMVLLAFLGVFSAVFPGTGSPKADPLVVFQTGLAKTGPAKTNPAKTSPAKTGPVTDKGPAPILVCADIMGLDAIDPPKNSHESGKQEAEPKPEKKPAGGPVIWLPDDCGCSPVPSRKPERKGVITYGFFHKGFELETDKKTGAATAKIKFSRINRIGYHSLVYDKDKGFLNYEAWEDNPYVRTARRYNSQVDIVVTFSDSVSQLFANKDKTRILAGDIQRLIKNFGGSGVTIDLRGTSALGSEVIDLEVLEGFLMVLREKLLSLDRELFLNLMTGFDPEAKDGPFGGFTVEEIANMTLPLDLFLVELAPGAGGAEQVKALFLKLSKLLDQYGLTNNNIEFKDKTLPVLPSIEDADGEIFTQILTVGYGGVGLWPDKGLGDAQTRFISEVFNAYPSVKNVDMVKKILEKICPNCCKQICPNRHLLLVSTYILGLVLLIYLLSSFFFCELRALAKLYFKYFLGAVLLLVAMVLGIVLCVPFWQGMRTLAVVIVFLLCVGGFLVEIIRRKRLERAP